ncbi:hypothetical protein VCHENC02_1520A, partial [Vibrio harveyi]
MISSSSMRSLRRRCIC